GSTTSLQLVKVFLSRTYSYPLSSTILTLYTLSSCAFSPSSCSSPPRSSRSLSPSIPPSPVARSLRVLPPPPWSSAPPSTRISPSTLSLCRPCCKIS
ncbi:hypothetical protein OF83DRAFT_1279149, partial [Amylostereum chailletii]